MATIYANAAGTILGLDRDDAEAALRGGPRPGATQSVTFDEATNAATLTDCLANPDAYRVVGGVLQKNGVAVTPAADAPATADRRAVKNNLAPIFAALRAGTATPAQQQRVLAFLLRQFLQG
jgi:hypothetical protein